MTDELTVHSCLTDDYQCSYYKVVPTNIYKTIFTRFNVKLEIKYNT